MSESTVYHLNELDSAIYMYMQDKPNILVELKKIYFDLRNTYSELNYSLFKEYLTAALKTFPQLRIIEGSGCDLFEYPKVQYLILSNKLDDNKEIKVNLIEFNNNKTITLYEKYHKILSELDSIKNSVISSKKDCHKNMGDVIDLIKNLIKSENDYNKITSKLDILDRNNSIIFYSIMVFFVYEIITKLFLG